MIAGVGVLLCAAVLSDPSAAPSAPIGPDAVFAPPAGFLADIHRACDAKAVPAFGQCFVSEMDKAGASAAALAFTHATDDQGYLRDFRETGVVDVACADYPFRANENAVCFLVNGHPPMIDVDDLSRIDPSSLAHDRAYAALLQAYPDLAIFPGDRSAADAVRVRRTSGGLRFEADYQLLDFCHACPRVGTMRLGFDFDSRGNFVGTAVLSVRPPRR